MRYGVVPGKANENSAWTNESVMPKMKRIRNEAKSNITGLGQLRGR